MVQLERKTFNPRSLTYARIARGLTMKSLAEESGISRQTISGYESGKSVPRGNNLIKLSQILDFPITYFNEKITPLNPGGTFFRSRASSTKKARDMQKVRLIYSSRIYNLLSKYVNFPQLNIPKPIDKSIETISKNEINEMAKKTRHIWGLDDFEPVNNLTKLVEANGIILSQGNLHETKIDAVSKWIGDRPFILLTDNSESAVRRRFNIAHELGHILLHVGVESVYALSNTEMHKLEEQANYFASCLLMPDRAFINSVTSTSIEGFIELKKYWKVSIAAMIKKAKDTLLINENQSLYLNKKLSYNHWRKKEPLDDKIKIEVPNLYDQVCQLIVENNVLSKQGLKALINLPDNETKILISYRFAKANINKNDKKLGLHIVK